MPRRNSPPKRVIAPDVRYNNIHVEMFINRMMFGGKKSTARQIMYRAFAHIEERLKRDPVEVFEVAPAQRNAHRGSQGASRRRLNLPGAGGNHATTALAPWRCVGC